MTKREHRYHESKKVKFLRFKKGRLSVKKGTREEMLLSALSFPTSISQYDSPRLERFIFDEHKQWIEP